MNKKQLEKKVEKEMREVMESELFNNETFNLMVEKMVTVLEQLPNEPVENEFLKEMFLRIRKKIDLNEMRKL
tara:strand:+ start:102 stop:317 length:216 start_codon:yes stop_codon:yes gene_type:complete